MDPITLVLTALAAGAAAGVQEVAGKAIKDAYQGLKSLLQKKFGDKPEAEMVLDKYEEKPAIWEAPLKDALKTTKADQDEEIIKAAQSLLSLANPQQAALGKYNVQITGDVQGFVQGDNANVDMTFGDKPSK